MCLAVPHFTRLTSSITPPAESSGLLRCSSSRPSEIAALRRRAQTTAWPTLGPCRRPPPSLTARTLPRPFSAWRGGRTTDTLLCVITPTLPCPTLPTSPRPPALLCGGVALGRCSAGLSFPLSQRSSSAASEASPLQRGVVTKGRWSVMPSWLSRPCGAVNRPGSALLPGAVSRSCGWPSSRCAEAAGVLVTAHSRPRPRWPSVESHRMRLGAGGSLSSRSPSVLRLSTISLA